MRMSDTEIERLALETLIDADDKSSSADLVLLAVENNTRLLQQLVAKLDTSRPAILDADQVDSSSLDRIAVLEDQVLELEQQNSELAAQIAGSEVREAVSTASSSCHDALSWEERKELIFQQMENETFDANAFVESLADSRDDASLDAVESPQQFVETLQRNLEQAEESLASRESEIQELRNLLDQQSETRSGGVAIGAGAIAEMIDNDELVREERKRLQVLQAEWEEKLRQREIEASLERARLSRERQELAHKTADLELKLSEVKRMLKRSPEMQREGRRWLAELGLSE